MHIAEWKIKYRRALLGFKSMMFGTGIRTLIEYKKQLLVEVIG